MHISLPNKCILDVVSMSYMNYTLHYVTKLIVNKYLKMNYNWLTFLLFFFNFKTNYEVSTPISLKTNNKKHIFLYIMFIYVSIVLGNKRITIYSCILKLW